MGLDQAVAGGVRSESAVVAVRAGEYVLRHSGFGVGGLGFRV